MSIHLPCILLLDLIYKNNRLCKRSLTWLTLRDDFRTFKWEKYLNWLNYFTFKIIKYRKSNSVFYKT